MVRHFVDPGERRRRGEKKVRVTRGRDCRGKGADSQCHAPRQAEISQNGIDQTGTLPTRGNEDVGKVEQPLSAELPAPY